MTFYIISLIFTFVLTLFGWNLVRFMINQEEDKQIYEKISQIQTRISSFSTDKATMVNNILLETRIVQELQRANPQNLERFLTVNSSHNGFFVVYNSNQELIYGERIIPLERYLPLIFHPDRSPRNQFFIDLGRDNFHVTYELVRNPLTENNDILVAIFYLEPFAIHRLDTTFNFPVFQITQTDFVDYISLPQEYRELSNEIKNSLRRSSHSNQTTNVIRLSMENALGLIVRYDLNNDPVMFLVIPFTRDYNIFAHQALLIFILIFLAMALIIISFGGAWFSKQIISPIKDISRKMQDIEQNPSFIEPMPKKYHGVLGNMVDTFNSMNNSLSRYSQSLLEYKTIINNLDSGILWMDEDFNIILCNPKILEIFNVEAFQDIIGRNLKDFINLSKDSFDKARNRELFIPHLEITSAEEKKIIKFVIFNIRAVDDDAGLRFVTSITDITREAKEARARERLELELIKSNRLADLGRMVEGVVHNINSPLNTIVGFAQLIKKQHPDNQDVDKIISAGNNIAKNVRQLMTKVKEDSISMMRLIDINDVVTQELETCQHNIFFAHSVKLVTDLAPMDKKINATHGEISLCIANMINNAIQSMENTEEKVLTVKTRLQDNMVAVEISDTGTGIPKENLEKLFSPEFSTKDAQDGEGFGLGLPLSKSIAEKYKGYITVHSTVGEGSTFTLYIPWQL
ncbi:MAG: GHKL domain-containing protein [Candidatus Cloacimonetes bacterium]|nr:GHKL domain-containing protein [Candidatus Cloacimonadota bacterium]